MKFFWILIVSSFLSTWAVGAENLNQAQFYWSSTRSFYACSYAEAQAARYLKALGAENIKSRCSGGIAVGSQWNPLSMTVSFTLPESSENRTVVLRARESCDFNVSLVESLVREVRHDIISKQLNCLDSDGSFQYELSMVP